VDLTSSLTAGALGVVVGAGAATAWLRSRPRVESATEGDDGRPEDGLPDGATAVLSILPGGAAVVDRLGRAVWATPPAYSWGLVRDGRVVHPAVLESIRAVHADGGSSSLEVELRRRRGARGLPVAVHVAPLTAELAVVLAEDRSDARRVDDVRRDFVALSLIHI
jgi:two-component system sensor histidine kinase SenX3